MVHSRISNPHLLTEPMQSPLPFQLIESMTNCTQIDCLAKTEHVTLQQCGAEQHTIRQCSGGFGPGGGLDHHGSIYATAGGPGGGLSLGGFGAVANDFGDLQVHSGCPCH